MRIREDNPSGTSKARGGSLVPAEWDAIASVLNLTPREVEIIQTLMAGRHEPEIGSELGISSHTVHTHLGRIYRKLNVHSLPGLLLRVFGAYVEIVRSDATPDIPAIRAKSTTSPRT